LQVQHGLERYGRTARSPSARAMSHCGPLPVNRCTGGRPANKTEGGTTRRLSGIEAASRTKREEKLYQSGPRRRNATFPSKKKEVKSSQVSTLPNAKSATFPSKKRGAGMIKGYH
jgi:hypothetical protein